MEGSFDIFVDVGGIVHLIADEHFFSGKGWLILVWYFLPFFVLHLPFGLEDQLEGVSEGLFVVGDVEVGVPCVDCFHQEVVDAEGLVVGPEVEAAESDQGQEVAVSEWRFEVGVHLQLYYYCEDQKAIALPHLSLSGIISDM